MGDFPSYPQILNLGSPGLEHLFDGPVVIQEKVDGSQLSFGVLGGQLRIRSKRTDLYPGAADGMFSEAIKEIEARAEYLRPGLIYRGEYLQRTKHNMLTYSRVPLGHIALFDIYDTRAVIGGWMLPGVIQTWAGYLGLEAVPLIHEGEYRPSLDELEKLLDRESILGGTKIEGVVIKNYGQPNRFGQPTFGKLVSSAFREVHQREWKQTTTKDVVQELVAAYATPARWGKALHHLREEGKLQGALQDIGPLVGEVVADVKAEEAEAIKDALFGHYWPQIARGITRGLPEWYKERLLAGSGRDGQ